MKHSKVKKVKVQLGSSSGDIAEMFNQMLGTGDVNMTIAYPRYQRIRGLCEQYVKVFDILAASPPMTAYTDMHAARDEIRAYCIGAKNQIAELFTVDLSHIEWNLSAVTDAEKETFRTCYDNVKKSPFVKEIISAAKHLSAHKKNFVDINALKYKFIRTMPGAEWKPFEFTTLNMKSLVANPLIKENTIMFFMTVISKVYGFSTKMYEEITSPDIDIDQFSDFIMESLDKLQKRPELSRCKEAFQRIRESINMLRDRLGGYYRDFVATSDSTIMLQHFIIDVGKESSADMKVTRQFQTIISYYTKIAQNQSQDPKTKHIFDALNKRFSEFSSARDGDVDVTDDSK